MSLRWSESICAALMPGSVSVAVWPRGWSPSPSERAGLACPADGAGPRWAPALNGLREWLGRSGRRRAGLRLMLSSQFVRYLVVPWNDALTRRAEREAVARHLLRETYGERADDWHLKVAEAPYGAPALACAVDRELYAAIESIFPGTVLRLQALQPLLMVAFNQFRHELAADACLLVFEADCLCCAIFRDGHWHSVHTTRVGAGGWDEALVERQIAVHGITPDMPVLLFDATGLAGTQRDGQAYRVLKPPAARRADPALALFAQPA